MSFVRVSAHSDHGRPYESLKGAVAQAKSEWTKVVSTLKPQHQPEATRNSGQSSRQQPVKK